MKNILSYNLLKSFSSLIIVSAPLIMITMIIILVHHNWNAPDIIGIKDADIIYASQSLSIKQCMSL